MNPSSENLQKLLGHARAVLHEADRVVAAAHALQVAAGMDATQLRGRLEREGGAAAVKKARERVDALLERRDALIHAQAVPLLRAVRPGRTARVRTNLA